MRDYSWVGPTTHYPTTSSIPTHHIVSVLDNHSSLAQSAALNGVSEETLRERLKLELEIRSRVDA